MNRWLFGVFEIGTKMVVWLLMHGCGVHIYSGWLSMEPHYLLIKLFDIKRSFLEGNFETNLQFELFTASPGAFCCTSHFETPGGGGVSRSDAKRPSGVLG